MDTDQPARGDPMVERPGRDAARDELRASGDAALALRHRSTMRPRVPAGPGSREEGAPSVRSWNDGGMERLILVRHGESTWNADERLQGQLDPPLSERGREQARSLARAVEALGIPPERIVCSDLTRATETAELLGVEPAAFDPRWREIDVGEWAGRPAAEIDALDGDLTNWRGGPRTAPDGEPWDMFAARIMDAADDLLAQGGSWLVVCHGGCIRVATSHLTGADPLRLAPPPNGSLTALAVDSQPPRLLVYGALPDGGAGTGLY
jgi:probable phosphoglycerate mutase